MASSRPRSPYHARSPPRYSLPLTGANHSNRCNYDHHGQLHDFPYHDRYIYSLRQKVHSTVTATAATRTEYLPNHLRMFTDKLPGRFACTSPARRQKLLPSREIPGLRLRWFKSMDANRCRYAHSGQSMSCWWWSRWLPLLNINILSSQFIVFFIQGCPLIYFISPKLIPCNILSASFDFMSFCFIGPLHPPGLTNFPTGYPL
jgi:hypothetical protein